MSVHKRGTLTGVMCTVDSLHCVLLDHLCLVGCLFLFDPRHAVDTGHASIAAFSTGRFRLNLIVAVKCFFRIQENFELLKDRLQRIQESKCALEVDLNRRANHNRTLISEMNAMKPEIKRLLRQRDSLKKWLLDHGKSHDFVDSVLESRSEIG